MAITQSFRKTLWTSRSRSPTSYDITGDLGGLKAGMIDSGPVPKGTTSIEVILEDGKVEKKKDLDDVTKFLDGTLYEDKKNNLTKIEFGLSSYKATVLQVDAVGAERIAREWYTQEEVDTRVDKKADKGTSYTKAESDAKYAPKPAEKPKEDSKSKAKAAPKA